MTYRDRTWCWANCKADGSCGRKLTEQDGEIIRKNDFDILYADLSTGCELYIPDFIIDEVISMKVVGEDGKTIFEMKPDGGEDAIKT